MKNIASVFSLFMLVIIIQWSSIKEEVIEWFFLKAPITKIENLVNTHDVKKTFTHSSSIVMKDDNVMNVSFSFLANHVPNHSIIFQTDDQAKGLKIEISNHKVFIFYQNKGMIKSLTLGDNFETNKWYKVNIKAINNHFLSASLGNNNPERIYGNRAPNYTINNLSFGSVTDNKKYSGLFKDINVSTAKSLFTLHTQALVYVLDLLSIIFLASIILRMAFKQAFSEHRQLTAVKHFYDPLLTLRTFACFLVLFGHGFLIAFPSAHLETYIIASNLWVITSSPWAGVWVFFVLSGYLMGKGFYSGRYQITKGSILNFYRNRIVRIVPVYWFAVIVVCLCLNRGLFHIENSMLIFNMLMLDPHASPIGALWSVSTEVLFYLLVPIIFYLTFPLTNRFSMKVGLLLIGIMFLQGLIYRVWCWDNLGGIKAWNSFLYKSLSGNIDLFLIGFFVNPVIYSLKSRSKYITNGLSIGLFLMFLAYLLSSYLGAMGMVVNDIISRFYLLCVWPSFLGLLVAAVIILFELSAPISMNDKTWPTSIIRRTQLMGLLTYSAYVVHEPIIMYLHNEFPVNANFMVSCIYFSIAMIIVYLVAYTTWRLVERPFEKMKRLKVHHNIELNAESEESAETNKLATHLVP